MRTFPSTNVDSRGFTLLEVLIAVVVLAVGLLALAALQGSLTRSSADAKVRGRVGAMLAARMDGLRSGGYGNLVDGGPTTLTSTTDDCDPATPDASDWMDCTRVQAGLGSLTTTQTITTWAGPASFTAGAAGPTVPQFKRVTLVASWDDPTGGNHQLSFASDVSSLALTNNVILPPDDQTAGGGGPIVRTINPSTPGLIPIALSTTSVSSASNPVPELVGRNNNQKIVGTKFTVLNYTPPSGSAVVIQKRFENEIIKCSCRYGAGGTNLPEIYRTAQWPAIWTGDRYDVFKPTSAGSAPGQVAGSGPKPGVQQSPLCQECCRDHHDGNATGVAKFDPERRDGSTSKYDVNGAGNLVLAVSNGTYVDACRVIRVDGFWRTAADMYSRQFGLLETESENGDAAKTGVPTAGATSAYTGFVKDYLKQYDGTASTAPTGAQALFDGTSGINVPSLVTIAAASNTDYRYLHGRGLYVDYLEDKARTRLSDVIADDSPQGQCPSGSDIEDCVLPHLPFVSANLTEIARWLASDPNVLTINQGNLLPNPSDPSQEPDPTKPSGSRTIGKALGTSDNTASIRMSNSGVAVNAVLATVKGVDPTDDSDSVSDAQPFRVGGNVDAGPAFDVGVSGGGLNPFVYFSILTDVDRNCLKPSDSYHCVTATGTVLPQAGSVKIANYWIETTTSQTITATCTNNQGPVSSTATIQVPTFVNHAVTMATNGAASGSIAAPVNDNKKTESATIAFASIAANDLIVLTLAEQQGSPTYATVASCTTNDAPNAGTEINNVVWNKPWELP
jgi:prepilin-type N-terminal cleavage/methylation domain-containing protein